jgi:hypothetical protein
MTVIQWSSSTKAASAQRIEPSGGESPRLSVADIGSRLGAVADCMTELMRVESMQRHSQAQESAGQIQCQRLATQQALDRVHAAISQAREAAKSKGWWSDVAGVAGTVAKLGAAVAAVASIVVTGGLSAPAVLALAGAVLSLGGRPLLKELGASDNLANAALYAGGACSLVSGGMVLSGVGVATSTTSAASGAAGASAASTAAGAATSASSPVASVVGTCAQGCEGGATAVAGIATAAGGDAAYRELNAQATVCAENGEQQRLQGSMRAIFGSLRDVEQSFRRVSESMGEAQQLWGQSLQSSANFGGAQ